ncbi:MAG: class I SAM-dependent methyltransferase [Roseibium sp.]|nr:class I SAM-dependent methyltransferase [Roseibium sp.]
MGIIDACLKLYEGRDYFVSYPARTERQEYWNQTRDPDGNIRDIRSERDLRKADVAYIADHLNRLPSGRVIDVGCGLGELLEQVDARHDRLGFDLSEAAVRATGDLPGVSAERRAFTEGCVDPGSCRAIVAHHVIEHMEDPVAFVKVVRTSLSDGGVFVCGTPNFACAAARIYGDRFRLLHDPTHVALFTDESLMRLLRDVGFRIVSVEYPFFGTRYATDEAWRKMLAGDAPVSPPFWGSFVTVFAEKD